MLDIRQQANARGILLEVHAEGYSQAVGVACIACSLVEAELYVYSSDRVPGSKDYPHDRNSPGDALSCGLYQQQPWWGSVWDRMHDAATTRCFLHGNHSAGLVSGLVDQANWQARVDGSDYDIGVLIQDVQISAFPDRYEARVEEARGIVRQLWADPTSSPHTGRPEFSASAMADIYVRGDRAKHGSVAVVMKALFKLGFHPGANDGVYDDGVRRAYSLWQQRLGFAGKDANGLPGTTSFADLGKLTGYFIGVA